MTLNILHTSDWHLGHTLYGQRRDHEFSGFLKHLLHIINEQKIDILIVAGDVFDTTTPSYKTQQLYYDFLHQIRDTCCQHVVIVAGNHDAPALLEAPKFLLKPLNIHVLGQVQETITEQVITLNDDTATPIAIICMVPYLRERDMRLVNAGESMDDKNTKLATGIYQHYHELAQYAETLRQQRPIPIIATGHLFAQGGHSGDGERDLYIGGLGQVSSACFPDTFNYVALGHLHRAQRVQQQDRIQYCGAPIAMGFNEATSIKQVNIIKFRQGTQVAQVSSLPLPCFQSLVSITGTWEHIEQQLEQLIKQQHSIWVDIQYTGLDVMADLKERVQQRLVNTSVIALRIRQPLMDAYLITDHQAPIEASELDPSEVFESCLEQHQVPDAQKDSLRLSYQEILEQVLTNTQE